jgi:hypothetical protein
MMLLTTRQISAPEALLERTPEDADAVAPQLRATGRRIRPIGTAESLASLRESALGGVREERSRPQRTRLRRRLSTWIGWDQAVAAWDASYERQADLV